MYKLTRRRQRDERGAFAVMYALMLVMLVSVAALGMDLGNAVSRKTDTQNQADFAAYDVGIQRAQEIASGAGKLLPNDPIVIDVADSFNKNQPQNDEDACWRNDPVDCVTPAQLVDCDPLGCTSEQLANGEVRYTSEGLQVIAPLTRVNFGFANVFGSSGTWVQSDATVSVFSAGPRVFPVFAMDASCGSYRHNEGFQTVKESPNGQTEPPAVRPTLLNDTEFNATQLTSVEMVDSGGEVVEAFAVDSTNNGIRLTGIKWGPTTRIAFFKSPDVMLEPIVTGTPITSSGNTPRTVDVQVPDALTAEPGVWYVRVYNDGTGQNKGWSAKAEAQVVLVDSASIIPGCPAGGSDQGNFGVVDFPRTGNLNDNAEVPLNLIKGTEDPFSLQVHKEAAGPDWRCNEPDNNANESNPGPEPKTNCLNTVTGARMPPFQQGLVDGVGSDPGLLIADNTSICGGSRVSIRTQSADRSLNNDPLSCFLDLPTGVTLSDISKMNYHGPAAFKPEIFDSPRFGYVPIFRGDPASLSGSEKRSIVGFQAAFITDSPSDGPGADGVHGLVFEEFGNGKYELKAVNMFLFGVGALPSPPDDAELIDYLGVGDPIVHLID